MRFWIKKNRPDALSKYLRKIFRFHGRASVGVFRTPRDELYAGYLRDKKKPGHPDPDVNIPSMQPMPRAVKTVDWRTDP